MNKQKQSKFNSLMSKTPTDIKKFVDLSFDIVDEVDAELTRTGKTRSDLADLLNKNESEISKVLSGLHNLTIKSICKISGVLGIDIITTPSKEAAKHLDRISILEKQIKELNNNLEKKIEFQETIFLQVTYPTLINLSDEFTSINAVDLDSGSWNIQKNDDLHQGFSLFPLEKKYKNRELTLG